MDSSRITERNWVLRPEPGRPAQLRALSGAPVHGVGAVGADGRREVILADGTRVRVSGTEIVAE